MSNHAIFCFYKRESSNAYLDVVLTLTTYSSNVNKKILAGKLQHNEVQKEYTHTHLETSIDRINHYLTLHIKNLRLLS